MSIVILDVKSLLLELGICIPYFHLCFTVSCQLMSQAGLQHLDPVDYFLLGYGAWGMCGYLWPHFKLLPTFASYPAHTDQEYQIFPYFSSLFFSCKHSGLPIVCSNLGSGLWPVKLRAILCSANQTWTSVTDHCSNGPETSVKNWTQFQI